VPQAAHSCHLANFSIKPVRLDLRHHDDLGCGIPFARFTTLTKLFGSGGATCSFGLPQRFDFPSSVLSML
jgi:hypothetical protein